MSIVQGIASYNSTLAEFQTSRLIILPTDFIPPISCNCFGRKPHILLLTRTVWPSYPTPREILHAPAPLASSSQARAVHASSRAYFLELAGFEAKSHVREERRKLRGWPGRREIRGLQRLANLALLSLVIRLHSKLRFTQLPLAPRAHCSAALTRADELMHLRWTRLLYVLCAHFAEKKTIIGLYLLSLRKIGNPMLLNSNLEMRILPEINLNPDMTHLWHMLIEISPRSLWELRKKLGPNSYECLNYQSSNKLHHCLHSSIYFFRAKRVVNVHLCIVIILKVEITFYKWDDSVTSEIHKTTSSGFRKFR